MVRARSTVWCTVSCARDAAAQSIARPWRSVTPAMNAGKRHSPIGAPTKFVAYNFFARVRPCSHIVQVMVAAGNGIDLNDLPQVGSLVATLEPRQEADMTGRQRPSSPGDAGRGC